MVFFWPLELFNCTSEFLAMIVWVRSEANSDLGASFDPSARRQYLT